VVTEERHALSVSTKAEEANMNDDTRKTGKALRLERLEKGVSCRRQAFFMQRSEERVVQIERKKYVRPDAARRYHTALAIAGLRQLENQLTTVDWQPTSLFGGAGTSPLPVLFGVMMKIPQLKGQLEELGGKHGPGQTRLAEIAQAWVSGASIEKIAQDYFDGTAENFTDAITAACKGVYRSLSNAGTWGLSALSKLSGMDVESLSPEVRRSIANLPAMLYHGVKTEGAIAMRMSCVDLRRHF
jgi:hypothetical protein